MTDFFTTNINEFQKYIYRNEPTNKELNNVGVAIYSSNYKKINPTELNNVFIHLIMTSIINDPEAWNKYGNINAELIGGDLLYYLTEKEEEEDKIRLLYLIFMVALEYKLASSYDLNHQTLALINYYHSDEFEAPADTKKLFDDAIKAMPHQILKRLFTSDLRDKISKIESFTEKTENSLKTIKDFDSSWDKKLIDREQKIHALDEKLKKYESGFNFVGLNHGFNNLRKNKVIELDALNNNIKTWKVATITIPFISILILLFLAYSAIPSKVQAPYFILPLFTLFILSLYFYRVALIAQKSIKSQILQIDLRMTLCQFIQSYADYSKDLKDKNEHTLHRFEEIIFSGLVANDAELPTTFDGLQQLSKFIETIKK